MVTNTNDLVTYQLSYPDNVSTLQTEQGQRDLKIFLN